MIRKHIIAFIFFIAPLFAFSQQEIKLMSYNIRLDVKADGENWWENRNDKVAGLMNYYEADFSCGQEVQNHQLKYLLEKLTGYNYIGVGRDDGKEAGEYSCIFYKNDKFDVVQQSTFWLSPTPDSVSMGWDAAIVRVCTYGLFKDKKTMQLFRVFNTHFDDKRIRVSKFATLTDSYDMKYPSDHFPILATINIDK